MTEDKRVKYPDYTESFSRKGEKSFKIHNTEKNTFIREAGMRVQLRGARQVLFFQGERERDNHVGRIGTKLTQNTSVYNKLRLEQPAGDLVLPASPAVTKTKTVIRQRITNKTNRQKSQTLKQRIQVILLVFKWQHIQIWGGWGLGGGITDGFNRKQFKKPNQTINEDSHNPADPLEVPLV